MPKFENRDEYERWKAEKMQGSAQPQPELFSEPYATETDVPEGKNKKTGLYIALIIMAVAVLSVFVIYRMFSSNETWTDTSYTNLELGFTMDIPEGWDKYDFTMKEKAMFKMEKLGGSRGKLIFTLTPDNRRDIGYSMMYIDTKGVDAGNNDRVIGSLASAFSRQRYKTEQFRKNIAGIDIPFVRASNRDRSIFIMGSITVSPEKMFFVQYASNSGEYEEKFWESVESFELL